MGSLDLIPILLLVAGGTAAGTLGGILGIGGGIILIPLLRFGVGLSPALAAGTGVVAVACTTLGGSFKHLRQGTLALRPMVPLLVAGAISALIFSLLFNVLSRRDAWMDLAMGCVFVLISGRMLYEVWLVPPRCEVVGAKDCIPMGHIPLKMGIGIVGGVLPGILGIGTGGILVPSLTYALRAPVKCAMAASLAGFALNAVISAYMKASQGMVIWSAAIPLSLGALMGATVGASLNGKWSSRILRALFGIVFAIIAVKFIWSYVGGHP